MEKTDPVARFYQAQEQARESFNYVEEGFFQALGCMEAAESDNFKLRRLVHDLIECMSHYECDESCSRYISNPPCLEQRVNKGGQVIEEVYGTCCRAGLENCRGVKLDADALMCERGIG